MPPAPELRAEAVLVEVGAEVAMRTLYVLFGLWLLRGFAGAVLVLAALAWLGWLSWWVPAAVVVAAGVNSYLVVSSLEASRNE
jgi:hypothetical protein